MCALPVCILVQPAPRVNLSFNLQIPWPIGVCVGHMARIRDTHTHTRKMPSPKLPPMHVIVLTHTCGHLLACVYT